MRKLLIGIVMTAVISVSVIGTTTSVSADSNTPWVNDSSYSGGGFYLDPLSCQVWTSTQGWHSRTASGSPLWVDFPYGPSHGYYWDPISCMVWTSDANWHTFNPAGIWPSQSPSTDPCARQLALGETVQVQPGCFVTGDVKVSATQNGPWEDLSFDTNPKTGTLVLVVNPLWVQAPFGASVWGTNQLNDAVNGLLKNGCEGGCTWVNVTRR